MAFLHHSAEEITFWNIMVTAMGWKEGFVPFRDDHIGHSGRALLLNHDTLIIHTSTWSNIEGKVLRLHHFLQGAWNATVFDGHGWAADLHPLGSVRLEFAAGENSPIKAEPDYSWECSYYEGNLHLLPKGRTAWLDHLQRNAYYGSWSIEQQHLCLDYSDHVNKQDGFLRVRSFLDKKLLPIEFSPTDSRVYIPIM
jgi:hypothetical protein